MEAIANPVIRTKNSDSRWAALDILDGTTVIAEGKSPEAVSDIVDDAGVDYILTFVPKKGDRYIF